MLFPIYQTLKTYCRRVIVLGVLLLSLLFLGLGGVAAPAQAAESRSINQVLQQLAQGWEQGDVAKLEGLWEGAGTQATYMPVESPEILQGVQSIRRYYEQSIPVYDVTSLQIEHPSIDQQGDLAHVSANTRFVIRDSASSDPASSFEVRPRLSLTLQKMGDRWSLRHYAEVTALTGNAS